MVEGNEFKRWVLLIDGDPVSKSFICRDIVEAESICKDMLHEKCNKNTWRCTTFERFKYFKYDHTTNTWVKNVTDINKKPQRTVSFKSNKVRKSEERKKMEYQQMMLNKY